MAPPRVTYNPITHVVRLSNFLTTWEKMGAHAAFRHNKRFPRPLRIVCEGIIESSDGVLFASVSQDSLFTHDLRLTLCNDTYPEAQLVSKVLRFIQDTVQPYYDEPLTFLTTNVLDGNQPLLLRFEVTELVPDIIDQIKSVLEERFPHAINVSER